MKKLIIYGLIFAAVVTVAVALYGKREMERKPETAAEKPVDFSMTAAELQKAFEADETAATKKYADKVIEVSGTVAGISSNEKSTDISLVTPDDMTAITIQVLPAEKEKAMQYKTGDAIKVKGICTGKLMDIELNKGVIVK